LLPKTCSSSKSIFNKEIMEAKMARVKIDKDDSYFIAEYRRTFFD
jgi:hypothetical protein